MINSNHDSTSTKPEKIELEVDLSKESYVSNNAGGSGILTFKNSKKENLEYIAAENHSYIRDKESGHKVTFSNAGYAGYKQRLDNLQLAADALEGAFFYNYGLTAGGSKDAKTANEQYSKAINDSNFTYQILRQYYSEGDIPSDLIIHKINNAIEALDLIIRVLSHNQRERIAEINETIDRNANYNEAIYAVENNSDSKKIRNFIVEKKAFSKYKEQFAELCKYMVENQNIGFDKIIVEGKTHNAKDFIASNKALFFDVNSIDYTNKESGCNNPEGNSGDAMTGYISEFSDQTQSSGVLYVVPPFDTGNLPPIAMTH